MMNRISSIARTLTLANCMHQMYISSPSHRKVFVSVRAVRRDTKRACGWRCPQAPITEKKRTKLQWVHLRSIRSRHRCVPNSYASLRPYSAIRTKRFDLKISPKDDGRADWLICHRPSNGDLTFSFPAWSESKHFRQRTWSLCRSDRPSKFCLLS